MKKLQTILIVCIIGLSFAMSSCAEEVVFPDGEDTTTNPIGDPDS